MQYLGAGVVVSPFALPESPISITSGGRSRLYLGVPGGYTALVPTVSETQLRQALGVQTNQNRDGLSLSNQDFLF